MHRVILKEASTNSHEMAALLKAFDVVVNELGRTHNAADLSRVDLAKTVIKAAKEAPICRRSGMLDHRAIAVETAYQFLRNRRPAA